MPKGYGTLTSPQVVLQWGSPNGTGATVGNCGSAANVYIELRTTTAEKFDGEPGVQEECATGPGVLSTDL